MWNEHTYTAPNLRHKPITLKLPCLSLEAFPLPTKLITEIEPLPWILGFIPFLFFGVLTQVSDILNHFISFYTFLKFISILLWIKFSNLSFFCLTLCLFSLHFIYLPNFHYIYLLQFHYILFFTNSAVWYAIIGIPFLLENGHLDCFLFLNYCKEFLHVFSGVHLPERSWDLCQGEKLVDQKGSAHLQLA